jgi:hypothetical protein
MKYSALLMIISGVVIACFAAIQYVSMGAPNWAENPFVLGVALPLVLAAALVLTGAALWTVGGRGYTALAPASDRHPVVGSGG